MTTTPSRYRTSLAAVALVVTGALGGGVLASTVVANAAEDPAATTTTSTADTGSSASAPADRDETKAQRSDEQLLTGSDAERVTAAALAEYPGATISRVETDSGGVYEAHLVTADGDRLTVLVGEDFAVTGTDGHGPR
ncbi:MAG: hypothetical protein JWN88_745 [Frankiales bacterium]|jgi:hypothetical protein|nr:hypothetical protein [Frankiales bacterium]